MSNWEHLLERETARALRRIQIAAPDLAAARAREAQAHEEYSDSVIDGYNSHARREYCPENHGSVHTLLRLAERNAWRRYIKEVESHEHERSGE